MLTPSFYRRTPRVFVPRPQGAQYLILDTSQGLKQLSNAILFLPMLLWNKDSYLRFVLPFLSNEARAEEELEYGCMEIVSDAVTREYGYVTYHCQSELVLQAREGAHAIATFGRHLMQQLQAMRAYRNGELPYDFYGWCGEDDAVLIHTS